MSTAEKKKRGRPAKKTAPTAPETPATPTPEELAKRPVQTEIPGTERPRIRALDEAGEIYVDLRDKMQTAVKKFKEAKTKLAELMHKHSEGDNAKLPKNPETGEIIYRYDDMEIRLTPKEEELKVKHVESDDTVSVGKAPKDTTEGEA